MLKVNDIFESISGEGGGFLQGTWVTGVRLQGCNLTCSWCDTPQGQNDDGIIMGLFTVQDIIEKIQKIGNNHILITGGEPLLQKEVNDLIHGLLYKSFQVQVETNGSMTIPKLIPYKDSSLNWVIDYKNPSSGMQHEMLSIREFVDRFKDIDMLNNVSLSIKFVVKDNEDLDVSLNVIAYMIQHEIKADYILSPIDANGGLIQGIVKYIKDRNPNILNYITFSVQLHKIFKML